MISVEEAKALVMRSVEPLPVKEIPLHQTHGHFAATTVVAPYDHPAFDNSAVDGYAFAYASQNSYRVVAEIAAGDAFSKELQPGECVRIFTGAMLPPGADTVVMQEFVQREGDRITHSDNGLRSGANVRRKGEQLKAGDHVLAPGEPIGAAACGLLASVGVRMVKVHEWPTISIVITGGEFVDEPAPGKIFSSNDLMLASALKELGIHPQVFHAPDAPEELERTLRQAMSNCDLLITTGGVSVGDHDLVRPTLASIGAEILFHKVAQKPGKPMLFGKNERTIIFGLPGNPRAVMILFWEYVLPAIRRMMGAHQPGLETEDLPITAGLQLKGERSEFRAARVRGGTVELLRDEGSHMLSSLIAADALVYFPADRHEVKEGDAVEVHYLPWR